MIFAAHTAHSVFSPRINGHLFLFVKLRNFFYFWKNFSPVLFLHSVRRGNFVSAASSSQWQHNSSSLDSSVCLSVCPPLLPDCSHLVCKLWMCFSGAFQSLWSDGLPQWAFCFSPAIKNKGQKKPNKKPHVLTVKTQGSHTHLLRTDTGCFTHVCNPAENAQHAN